MSINIKQIHHVAYRCHDAKETMEFYRDKLNMKFLLAIAEDQVPSTKAPDPYMHLFMDAGNGNILAFFEIPTHPKMDRDRNTPEWVQHIAFELGSMEELLEAKADLESKGLDVLGVTDHGIIKSIYFFDPNGHRMELTVRTDKPGELEKLNEVAVPMIEEWAKTKKAPKHAAWIHENEFANS
ncbi:VOC family protein [Suttonella sp. R2A3]|uniref:VOC family protein n=1 Tax=Suttonella sp. R2A3 TaxID=2908648 RepID=UPI001F27D706|nr:VOC family protein [Suttonella sp. R2A3]UJF24230.1 VOC family protein [Suttonella sp. R2A3]